VDYLVRRAAQEQARQVAPTARAHHDHVDVVLDRLVNDVPRGIAEYRVSEVAVRKGPGRPVVRRLGR